MLKKDSLNNNNNEIQNLGTLQVLRCNILVFLKDNTSKTDNNPLTINLVTYIYIYVQI